jgi:tetratricopeptide (TPR) repeat protein
MPRTGSRAVNRSSATAAALLLAAALAYSRVFTLGFAFDDRSFILRNAKVLAGLSRDGIVWAFTSTYHANWQPLTWISCMLDVTLFGPGPAGFHAVNLALHLVNVVVLFRLLCRLSGAFWRPALVAALFALHPLNVETVAWITERSALLGTLFALLAITAYRGHAAAPAPARFAAVAALLALSLLAKPLWVTLPPLLLLLDFWPLGRIRPGARGTRPCRGVYAEKLLLLALSAAASAAALYSQRHWGALHDFDLVPLSSRVANAVIAYVRYVGLALWPSGLAVFYQLRVEPLLAEALAAAALLVAACAGVAVGWRRRPWLCVGGAWYLGSLVPMIGIVQVGSQAMADRYAYVPLLGLFVALAWELGETARRSRAAQRVVIVAATAACCALGAVTWAQTGYWRDDVTLFTRAVRVTGDNALAHFNLGTELLARGDLRGAREHLGEAVRLRPDGAEARVNLGLALVNDGEIAAGIEQYREALRLKPGAEARVDLGEALVRLGRRAEAEQEYRTALRLDPDNPTAHMNLANLLFETRRFDEALEHYRRAQRLAPRDARIPYNLGVMLASERRFAEAAAAYREALRLQSDHRAAHQGLRALPPAYR